MPRTLFLPGASGSADFWKPLARAAELEGVFLSWPGLGAEPARPDIAGIDDLTALAACEMSGPVDILAQSMGGLIALRLALAFPHLIRRLVLAVTSGGLPVTDLGGSDWHGEYFAAFPRAARWIADPVPDLSNHLPAIAAPTLLLWGDADPISPVAVGERLRALLPRARLLVLPGAGHDLIRTHATTVAPHVRRHLAGLGPQDAGS